MDIKKILFICLTVIFPPLGVYFYVGFSAQFWINLVLTILGYFPGIVHGIYILSTPNTHKFEP